ncbi:MAG: sulfur carrier protein ThiS [Deltaproteobacteria bacterium]|nr:sulfur carrier protein ThiS [Deltaproteobacteria bacterium]
MKILLNDDEIGFSGNTLIDLLNDCGLKSVSGIAIAVNETVISRNNWKSCFLKEGDSVLIITPSQGG